MIIHMYSAGMDEEGRVVIGRPGDAIEVPSGHRACGAPIGYPCTCPSCVAGSAAVTAAALGGWTGDAARGRAGGRRGGANGGVGERVTAGCRGVGAAEVGVAAGRCGGAG